MGETSSPPEPTKKGRVRAALRTATNLPPRAPLTILRAIAEYADFETGRNAFMSIGSLARETKYSERTAQRHVGFLKTGVWIAPQGAADPGQPLEAWLRMDVRHRPPVYRMVIETLRAVSELKGCQSVTPEANLRGDILSASGVTKRQLKGRHSVASRGDRMSPNHPPQALPVSLDLPRSSSSAEDDRVDLAVVLCARNNGTAKFSTIDLAIIDSIEACLKAERPLSAKRRERLNAYAKRARRAKTPSNGDFNPNVETF